MLATCKARRRHVRTFRRAAESEIRADRVPVALRSPLRSRIDALERRDRCLLPKELQKADDLAEWLRKRSAAVNVVPPDFRIARSALADDRSDGVVWAVIEPMWAALETPYEPDPRLAQATPGQRAAYALTWTASEVSNGGFDQYFWNDTGMLLDEAIAGARLIGAKDVEAVLREAASLFPEGRAPESRRQRQQALDAFSDDDHARLEQVDERFFELLDDPERSPTRFLEAYIDQHPDDFFLPGRR